MTERFLCRERNKDEKRRGYTDLLDWWRQDNTCSYCGSLHPDESLRLMAAGSLVQPSEHSDRVRFGDNHTIFFSHFSHAQAERFIDLHNERKMRIAPPGYFFVRPYFATESKPH